MIRSTLRAAYHVAAELIPVQALRCIVDRDYADAMYQAAAKHDGAEQRAEYEAEEEVGEPAPILCPADNAPCGCDRTSTGCGLFHCCSAVGDRGTGAIDNGDPQQVTLSGREYERYLDGALNEPVDTPAGIDLTDEEYDEFITAARGHGASPPWLRDMVYKTLAWARHNGATWEQINEWVGDTDLPAASAAGSPAGVDPIPQQSPPAGHLTGRFAAADWLEETLHKAGVESGAGWVLALVDGVLERANPPAPEADSDGGEVLAW